MVDAFVVKNKNLRTEDALATLDPSFIKENPDFVSSYKDINWEDINTLNTVLRNIEQLLQRYPTPNHNIKTCVEIIFTQILARYPLLFGYWKKFVAIEYQFHDLKVSLKTLETATTKFPNSLELWCDYLRVLIVNYPQEDKLIQAKIQQAKRILGNQFYSHPFWDLVIGYYSNLKRTEELIETYWEIVKIPLHQYAKFVEPFKKLLISNGMQADIKKLEKDVRLNQTQVTEIWKFESKIKQNFFNLTPLNENEVRNWQFYLDFLILNNKPNTIITSVFERCLIPCCFVEEYWIRYVEWLSKNEYGISDIIEVYQRAHKLLPTQYKNFRTHFVSFLKKRFKNDKNREYIHDVLNELLVALLSTWQTNSEQLMLMQEYLTLLKRYEYPSSIDMSAKEILSKQSTFANFLEGIISNYLNQKNSSQQHMDSTSELQAILNDMNLPVVCVELIKMTWLVLKNNIQTRKYFNHYSKISVLRNSTVYSLTYYKFEKSTKNFLKLNKFINELGNSIFLPTSVINDIVQDYRTFFLTNFNITEYRNLDYELIDPVLLSHFKVNNPQWIPHSYASIDSNDWYKTDEFKENGHPGIVSNRPQITNRIFDRDNKLLFRDNKALSAPTFRNLEKINQSSKFKDFYTDDYLNAK
ncbi:hypothetical protein KAFR_0E00420 [Kazachstania africana CBS 2517]|uniref:Suppressor of forked domain-containing protein n=1 Tax=Kazachstania africana (strain ATCC 22294 / BCRC 22015 / CBS 2517 / CECT 1963 / NBRC 1671 / NRRL Y-8276) TaxID=1071382 RepID=H2AUZ6_KAZAF|nr:hypothetical protein KAFR_0E00420 [Kazachstania africana CBS 2517]CCF58196.1 hypothetical protein KAFR_0E00420 [Kazachstania africana CBS 2517]